MKRITVVKWKEMTNNQKMNKLTGKLEQEVITSDSIGLITNLVLNLPPKDAPRGLEAFKITHKLYQSLEDARGKQYIYLEDDVYSFLKHKVFPTIPSSFGLIKNLSQAVNNLIHAQKHNPNEEKEEKDGKEKS